MLELAALAFSIPLHFEPNRGQVASDARYVAAAQGYTLLLSDTAVTTTFSSRASLRMNLPRSIPNGEGPLPGKSNYYMGAHPPAWRTNVPHYGSVRYRSLFPGIDLAIYGQSGRFEYDWLVAPGADASAIRFSFTGASGIRVDQNGDLVLRVAGGEMRHCKPSAYQMEDGLRHSIPIDYLVTRTRAVGFHVGPYDRNLPLVIDPVIVYSVGFGGHGYSPQTPQPVFYGDAGTSMALDRSGNIYIGGTSFSPDFPLVHSLPNESCPGSCSTGASFVAKLSPDGKTLLYSTYLVGGNPNPASFITGFAITADPDGNVYATGTASAQGFPRVGGGAVSTAGVDNVFVVKLDPSGALLGSTLFGGSAEDAGTSIQLGPDGMLYVAGTTVSPDFPTTPGAYQTGPSSAVSQHYVFLVKLNPGALNGAQAIIYSTYLGPGGGPIVATGPGGSAYVAASTGSAYVAASTGWGPWRTTPSAFQPQCKTTPNCTNAVLAKVDPTGARLLYATYFGGSGTETVGGLFVDASGSAYVSGTTSSVDLPVTSTAFQTKGPPPNAYYTVSAAFVAKFSPDATQLTYATYLSGTAGSKGHGITVGAAGNAYVAGETQSDDFPIRSGIQVSLQNVVCFRYGASGMVQGLVYCASAGTLAVLNPSGSGLVWSTFLGGGAVYAAALDAAGNVYATGSSIGLPGLPGGTVDSAPTNAAGLVKIAPQGTPLQFSWDGLTNAASFSPGLPAPGGLATLFVHGLDVAGTVVANTTPLPTELAGVSIAVDGVSAPILAVASLPAAGADAEQINFQVPFEVSGQWRAGALNLVEVRYKGLSTYAAPTAVGPGIFTLPDGSPAIQHASDFTPVSVSNPAAKGETIVVYLTGLGPVSSRPQTGMPSTGPAPVGACPIPAYVIGGVTRQDANILYAGLTPGYVGLYQVNLRIPMDAPSGSVDFQIVWNTLCSMVPSGFGQSNTVKLVVQ